MRWDCQVWGVRQVTMQSLDYPLQTGVDWEMYLRIMTCIKL